MKKVYAIAHGDILSFRFSNESRFKCRSLDSTERSILKAISTKKNYEDAVSHLASFYLCDKSEVSMRIAELSAEMFENSKVLGETPVYFWEKKEIMPVHIIAEITSRCNMYCKYCYGSFGRHDLSELRAKEWERFFSALLDDEMQKQTVQLLNITGGEPTMKKDLLEILEWSKGKFGVSLFINCMQVEDKLIDILVSHPTLIRVNTSFDSSEALIDEIMRGKGFLKRMENLIKLDSLNIPITVNIGVWRRSIKNIEKTIGFFCNKFKNTNIILGCINREGRAKQLNRRKLLTAQEYGVLSRKIESDLEHLRNRFHFEGKEDLLSNTKEENNETYRCNCGYGVIVINSQGILKPCVSPLSFFKKIGAVDYIKKLSLATCAQDVRFLIDSTSRDVKIGHLRNGCTLPYFIAQNKQ